MEVLKQRPENCRKDNCTTTMTMDETVADGTKETTNEINMGVVKVPVLGIRGQNKHSEAVS